MPWKRGTASLEVEMARVQDWIEGTDPELHGGEGERGVLREFHESYAFVKGALWVLLALGGADSILQVAHLFGWIK